MQATRRAHHAVGNISGRPAITTSLVIAAASALLLAQTPAQPFPHHETPPDGWHCVPARNAKELSTNPHACSCLGMVLEPMCGKTPDETIARQESNKCKVWCHRDACACAKTCGDT